VILAKKHLTELKDSSIAAPVVQITAVIAKTISLSLLPSGLTGTSIYKIRRIKMQEDGQEIQVHRVTSKSPNVAMVNICSLPRNGQPITSTIKTLQTAMVEVGMVNQDPKVNGASGLLKIQVNTLTT